MKNIFFLSRATRLSLKISRIREEKDKRTRVGEAAMRAETENEWREIDRRLALQTARIPRPCLLNIPIAACINVYSQILRAGVVESAETDRLSSGGKLSVKRDSSSRFDGFPNSSFVHHNFDRPALLPTPSIVNFPQRGKQKNLESFESFFRLKKKNDCSIVASISHHSQYDNSLKQRKTDRGVAMQL